MGQCPKNETELKAFNPENYQRLKQIAAVSYIYNPNQTYEFRVKIRGKAYTLVASPAFPEGFTSISE
jgi:hypothetical protein